MAPRLKTPSFEGYTHMPEMLIAILQKSHLVVTNSRPSRDLYYPIFIPIN